MFVFFLFILFIKIIIGALVNKVWLIVFLVWGFNLLFVVIINIIILVRFVLIVFILENVLWLGVLKNVIKCFFYLIW